MYKNVFSIIELIDELEIMYRFFDTHMGYPSEYKIL